MSHTSWPTLTDVSSIASAMNVTLTTAQGTAIQQSFLDSVINNFTTKTRRTWLTVTEDRFYDGNDTGEIEVNEFITLNSIDIVGWFGITSGLTILSPINVVRPTYPNTRIQVYRGSTPALYRVWLDRFVVGRGNIKINALWGYATTIPDDVWLGVALQAAGLLVNLSLFKTSGFLIKWSEEEVTEVRNYQDPFKFMGNGMSYKGLIELYKAPSAYRFRKMGRAMV